MAQEKRAARHRNQYIDEVSDVHDDRRKDIRKGVCLLRIVEKLVVDRVKPLFRLFLVAKDLDDLLSRHHLFNVPLGLADGRLLLPKILGGVAADLFHREQQERDAEEHHQRHPHAVVEHDGKQREHHHAGGKELRQTLRDQLAQGVDIIGVVAHDVAALVRVKILHRQALHMTKQLLAHLLQRSLR